MDSKFVKEEDDMRARSFRYENYNTRRVFLRSYPLQWGESVESKEETPEVHSGSKNIKPMKKMIVSVIEWSGGKILILRRFQHKMAIYVIACLPASIKPPTARISA